MHKPLLPALLVLFSSLGAFAQNFYFPTEKTTWIETGWWQNPDLVGFNFGGESNACQLGHDTLIQGKLYRNLGLWRVDSHYTYLGVQFDTSYTNEKVADAGAVRADSAGRIYYFHYGNIDLRHVFPWLSYSNQDTIPAQTELLLYDFSLLPGDTFTHPLDSNYTGIVDSVGWIDIAGSPRRFLRFYQPGNPGILLDTWLEGMGSLKGFFSPCAETVAEYAGGRLTCFQENNVWGMQVEYLWPFLNTYGSDIYCPSLTLGVKTPETVVQLKVSPNPSHDWIKVEFSGEKPEDVAVFDLLGRQRPVQVAYENSALKLNITSLAGGIHFLQFRAAGWNYLGRFIKR